MSCLKIHVKFPTLVNDECEIRNMNTGTHPSAEVCTWGKGNLCKKKSRAQAIQMNSNNGKVNMLFLWLFPQFHQMFMITYWIMVLIKIMKINIVMRLKYFFKVTVSHTSKTAQSSGNNATQIKRTHINQFTDSNPVYTHL